MPKVDANMIQTMLNNPAMSKMMSEMIGKQFGKNPEDMESLINCAKKNV